MIMNNEETKKERLSQEGQEQLEKVKKAIEETKKVKVLTQIKMRDGEEDIRKLPQRDKDQLNYRLLCDLWAFNKSQHDSLITIQIILMEIAKSMGIDIEKKLDELFNK